ncbi:DUF2577 domain-containing protein [Paenibacillus sp. NFR01]|uniref:DUF2577 domain-containing protein n=1 Tax=Paenibacillus sp. NFR01 TaxID=1566279 RepID=UPI0008C7FFAE|nr:DUF2577 domain-containing protein [Paenibacillus sp. NFR01]SEU26596.1 Protein of unknown function [Paenibacillus sp. NFR01]
MLDIIKKASLGAVANTNPVSLAYGLVTVADPLEVELNQRIRLSGAALVLPETVMESSVEFNGTKHTVRRGLMPGDRVLLMRMQGGQSYIVLDRLVEP